LCVDSFYAEKNAALIDCRYISFKALLIENQIKKGIDAKKIPAMNKEQSFTDFFHFSPVMRGVMARKITKEVQ
jgi:hypothetical protein